MNILSSINYIDILLPIALILLLGKFLALVCKKIGLPQVVGLLVAGILIGLIKLIPDQPLITSDSLEGISFISKIGVVLIMFGAGLETDVSKIKKTGIAAIFVTLLGVVVPLGLGFIIATLFNGGFSALGDKQILLSNLFYGTILTATSVSVTVQTLKELGKLDSNVGTVITSAAIIDDIIGVVLLSLIISLSGASQNAIDASYGARLLGHIFNTSPNAIWITIILTILCFVFIFGFGVIIKKFFNFMDKKYEHHRRIPIAGIAFAFMYAWICEMVFGVADITGAFFCGLILSKDRDKNYIERRSDILGYMLFTPVFFANVGLSINFETFDINILWFGICFILVGIIGKLVGCGLAAKCCGFNLRDSIKVGLGMMVRAEVALICVGKGSQFGLIDQNITTFVVLLIIITSFVTPICLKLLYKKEIEISLKQD